MPELRFGFKPILKLLVTQLHSNTCLKLNGSPPPGSNSAWRCTCWTPSFWSSFDIQNFSLDVLVGSVIPNPQLPGKSVRWVSLCRFSWSKSKQPYQRQELQLTPASHLDRILQKRKHREGKRVEVGILFTQGDFSPALSEQKHWRGWLEARSILRFNCLGSFRLRRQRAKL